MIQKILFALCACITILSACRNREKASTDLPVTLLDTTITAENAFTLIKLDSQMVSAYLDSASLNDTSKLLFRNFYNSRNFQYAWIDSNRLTEHANMLWNLYSEFRDYALNVPVADTALDNKMGRWTTAANDSISPSEILNVELKLTRLFFDYAFAKYIGNLKPADLQWHIPRRKIDVSALLDTLVSGSKNAVKEWEPLHPQYQNLKRHLLVYSKIAENGGWDSVSLGTLKKLQEGDSDSLIVKIKKRLQVTSNYPESDSSPAFNAALKDSLIIFQQLFGLKPTGAIGSETIAQLNVPVEQRIQQILINMERARWLPRQPESTWILANIPSFTLQVFENDSVGFRTNIVVGAAATKTVIFSNELRNIVFSPYWNVPPSIVKNEIVPAMKKNPNYLSRSRMEQTGTSGGLPVVRQLPGPGNALGKVKFLFPNEHNIYLHDTPAKSFFERTDRAFSHGCLRVEKPYLLAKYLLRNDKAWDDKTITKAMNGDKEKWVTLPRKIPVFITYFTTWVDKNNRIHFRKDVYGHDKRMADNLFKDL